MFNLFKNVWRSFVPKQTVSNCEVLNPAFIWEARICSAIYDEPWCWALFALTFKLLYCSIELVIRTRLVACHPSLRIHWMKWNIALLQWIACSTANQVVDASIIVALGDALEHTWRALLGLVPYLRVGNIKTEKIIEISQTCVLFIHQNLVWSATLVFTLRIRQAQIVLYEWTSLVTIHPTFWVNCK